MKLLIDEHLSRKLPGLLDPFYAGSVSVVGLGFRESTDLELWAYAKENGMVILTKDDDFRVLSVLRGPPPKVILLGLPNCSNLMVAELLNRSIEALRRFGEASESALLFLT